MSSTSLLFVLRAPMVRTAFLFYNTCNDVIIMSLLLIANVGSFRQFIYLMFRKIYEVNTSKVCYIISYHYGFLEYKNLYHACIKPGIQDFQPIKFHSIPCADIATSKYYSSKPMLSSIMP